MAKAISKRKYLIWGAHCSRASEYMSIIVGSVEAGKHHAGATAESLYLHLQAWDRKPTGNITGFWNLDPSPPSDTY